MLLGHLNIYISVMHPKGQLFFLNWTIKAFDTIGHEAILQVMRHKGFDAKKIGLGSKYIMYWNIFYSA
jgi:hypothetical protein